MVILFSFNILSAIFNLVVINSKFQDWDFFFYKQPPNIFFSELYPDLVFLKLCGFYNVFG